MRIFFKTRNTSIVLTIKPEFIHFSSGERLHDQARSGLSCEKADRVNKYEKNIAVRDFIITDLPIR